VTTAELSFWRTHPREPRGSNVKRRCS